MVRVITIAVGKWYERYATLTVPLMEHCLDAKVEVLRPEGDPFLAKLSLPLDEPFLFVDCDIVFRRKFDVRPLLKAAAQGEFVSPEGWYAKLQPKNLRPGVNAEPFSMLGMFAAGPRHAEAYAIARELYLGELKGAAWYDEQPMNVALDRTKTKRRFLTETQHRFMTLNAKKHPDDISRHYPSCHEPFQRFVSIRTAAVQARAELGIAGEVPWFGRQGQTL